MIPAWGRCPCASVASEAPRQLDVEGVEVDVAHAIEQLGGPGLGQGLGQPVAPVLVFFGRGRRSFGRTTVRTGSPTSRRARYRRDLLNQAGEAPR